MMGRPLRVALLVLSVMASAGQNARSDEPRKAPPRPPGSPAYQPLPLGRIRPAGWLAAQLRLQADGLGGQLDTFWPDIKDSAWFGGKAEGWERVPYWLDGLVPLAYLLDDPALKAKVERSIAYILDHQQPDGWLGPVGDRQNHKPYDVWPLFPLLKALTQYQEATGNPRVIPAMLKCCHKIDEVISKEPMYSWARFRAADLAVSLYWLHDRTNDPWLLDLARKAFAQSHDWRAQFDNFRYTAKTERQHDLDRHGVNIGMGLKYGGMRWRVSGDPADRDAVFRILDQLDSFHGMPTGIFTCDEHLAGKSPAQGTELCTVVEAMYSLEEQFVLDGDPRLADRLEKIAFNALPATFKKDMTAHQYDQQCNQVICARRGEHVYVSNGPDANLYGLEPNFGCCTANFHQGWPKFASHLSMKSADGGLAVVAYAPSVVETTIQSKPVKLAVETDYPFRDEIKIHVTVPEPLEFPIDLRIPGWAEQADIRLSGLGSYGFHFIHVRDGVTVGSPGIRLTFPRRDPVEGGATLRLETTWKETRTITMRMPMPVRITDSFNQSVAIERGPLVFALPISPEWRKIRDNPRFADWEVHPRSPWNYALSLDRAHPEQSLTFENRPMPAHPFEPDNPPVVARVKARRLPGWTLERNAAPPPPGPADSKEPLETLTLVPYGCTDLRITAFPVLRPHNNESQQTAN